MNERDIIISIAKLWKENEGVDFDATTDKNLLLLIKDTVERTLKNAIVLNDEDKQERYVQLVRSANKDSMEMDNPIRMAIMENDQRNKDYYTGFHEGEIFNSYQTVLAFWPKQLKDGVLDYKTEIED